MKSDKSDKQAAVTVATLTGHGVLVLTGVQLHSYLHELRLTGAELRELHLSGGE